MYEKCSKNILRSMFLLFCYIKKDQLILFAGRTCIYRLEHICRVRTKNVQVTVYMQEIQKAGFRADLACIYNKKERDYGTHFPAFHRARTNTGYYLS